jgi:gliding motility-associated-like protein
MIKWLLSFIFISLGSTVFGQTDTKFWFAPPQVINQPGNIHTNFPLFLRVTAFDVATNVTISQPANPSFTPINIALAANTSYSVDLTAQVDFLETKPANTQLNTGLLVTSTNPITAYYEENSRANPEMFVLKGNNALGTSFFIPAQNIMNNWGFYTPIPNPQPSSSFDIVATENNTDITIIPAKDIVGHAAGVAFTITLQMGQTYSAQAIGYDATDHLGGSTVTSNKPIAITIKDDSIGGAGYSGCLDLAGDQIVPLNLVGSKYITLPGYLNNPNSQPSDFVFLIATQNNTSIKINGVVEAVINKGETFKKPSYFNVFYIETSLPVYALHMSGFGCEVGHAMLPQIECTGSQKVAFTRSNDTRLYMNILVPTGYENAFTLNGNPNIIKASDFKVVPFSNGGWSYASIGLDQTILPIGAAALVKNSGIEFHLGVLHGDSASGSRYGYFSDFNFIKVSASSNAINGAICANSNLQFTTTYNNANALSFSWTGPNGFSSNLPNPSIPNINTSYSDTFRLTANKFSCKTVSINLPIIVNPIPKPVITLNSPICQGKTATINTNSILATTYQWQGPQGFSSTIANNSVSNIALLNAGLYKVSATQNGCTGFDSAMLQVNPTPLATIIANKNILCQGDSLFIANNNSLASTSYKWLIPNGLSSLQQNISLKNIQTSQSGLYKLTATINSCSSSDSVSILINPTPKPVVTLNSPICQGKTATINTNTILGTTYQWQGPQGFSSTIANNSVSNIALLNAGLYKVSATQNGCTGFDSAMLQVNPTPLATIIANKNILCQGDSLFIANNNSLASTSYKWLIPNGLSSLQQNISLKNIQTSQSGLYKLTATINSCSSSDSVSILINPTPKPVVTLNSPICQGKTATINTNTILGTTYQWQGPQGFSSTIASNSVSNIALLNAGLYKVSATQNGCTGFDSAMLHVNPTPVATIVANKSTLCQGDSLAFATINSIASTIYQWVGPNSFTSNNQNIAIKNIQLNQSGFYKLTTSLNGCTSNDSISVLVNPIPKVEFIANLALCSNDQPITLIAKELTGQIGVGVFTGNAIDKSGIFIPSQANIGNNTIRYSFTNSGNCSSFIDQNITVYESPTIFLEKEKTIVEGTSVYLSPKINGTYTNLWWTNANSLAYPNSINPLASPKKETNYKITISTNNKCVATDSITIKIATAIVIPNAFSPNNDNINDSWIVEDKTKTIDLKVSIFDRYGKFVHSCMGHKLIWDGTYNGSPLPVATYYYVITKIANGVTENIGGWIQLLK